MTAPHKPSRADLQAIIDAPGFGKGRAYIDQKAQEAEALALLPSPESMVPVRATNAPHDWFICSFGTSNVAEGEEWFLTTDSVRGSSLVDACFPDDAKLDAHAVAALLNAWRMGCIVPRALSDRNPDIDRLARAICREKCAFLGEPPCWSVEGEEWPPAECDEPGCWALAQAAAASLDETP